MHGWEPSRQTRALLRWLGEMDSSRVTTGLLAMAFEAGWAAHEAELRDQSHDAEKVRAWRDKDGDIWIEDGPGRLVQANQRGWSAREQVERDYGPLEELMTETELAARRLAARITVAGGWEAVGGDADTRAFVQSILDHDATPHDHVHIGADEPHAHVHAHGDTLGNTSTEHSHMHRHAGENEGSKR